MSKRNITQLRKWLLSSPPAEWALNQLRELTIGAIRQGPIPQHVAFVMDGNRRYARSHRIETVEGHNLGFEALARILEVCYKSGVKVVTVYAFSIENFKRSKYEVDHLMDMAKVKLSQLAEHGELLDRYGASIRLLGQRELVKPDVLEAVDRAVEITRHNDKAILNICFPYTSREEITTAIRDTVTEYSKPIERPPSASRTPFSQSHIEHSIRSQRFSSSPPTKHPSSRSAYLDTPEIRSSSPSSAASDTDPYEPSHSSLTSSTTTLNHEPAPSPTHSHTNILDSSEPRKAHKPSSSIYPSPELITSETLTSHMFTATNPPLDILIRTSGVERLSDFMLWQCHQETEIVFLDCLWPEFDLWKFLPVVWEWQWRQRRRGWTEGNGIGMTKVT